MFLNFFIFVQIVTCMIEHSTISADSLRIKNRFKTRDTYTIEKLVFHCQFHYTININISSVKSLKRTTMVREVDCIKPDLITCFCCLFFQDLELYHITRIQTCQHCNLVFNSCHCELTL